MVNQAPSLYAQLCTFGNLHGAFRRARRGKRDREEVAAFEYDLEENLFQLQEELATFIYRPGPYRSFYVHDSKRRLISAAPFRDRVVHHALVAVTEPLFEPRFIGDSYANRIGKGTHAALDRCQAFARRYRYVLQCDVRQFFPSVDHAILRAQLARIIRDEDVMWLVDRILAGGVGVLTGEYDLVWFPGDDLLAALRPRGLPIGNLTSQFWANVYLNDLDQFVRRTLRSRAYLRYVDDLLFFDDDKSTLHTWRSAVIERAASLRLTLHERQAQIYPASMGIPFLGFRVFPSYRRLKSRRGHAARRRLHALARQCADGRADIAMLTAAVRGWTAHAAHGDTWGLRRCVLKGIVV